MKRTSVICLGLLLLAAAAWADGPSAEQKPAVEQKKETGARLVLKMEFEDEIKGNNSAVALAPSQTESKWGKVGGLEARTTMAKEGKAWQAEQRVAGKKGYAYSFGGDTEKRYIKVPFWEDLDFGTEDFSVTFWLKTVSGSGHIVVFTTSAPYWGIWNAGGRIAFLIRDKVSLSTACIETGMSINDGNWHHVALVAGREGKAVIYVDGQVGASGSIAGNKGSLSKPAPLGIGGYGYDKYYYDGLLDSFRIYRGALTKDEVQAVFNE